MACKLIARADIVSENFKSGIMVKLELDAISLSKHTAGRPENPLLPGSSVNNIMGDMLPNV